MIDIIEYKKLDNDTVLNLNEIIDAEFGHIPLVKNTQWAIPDWTIIYSQNETLAAFYNIIEREVIMDDEKVKVAGVNNVITLKKYRGKGFSARLLKDTQHFIFDELRSKFGLLLCADTLIPYYQKLNWYKVDCPVYFSQPTGKKLWAANTMLLSNSHYENPELIDLNGLPW
ncbi:GNAT family N-acetyltransferase [Fulvivirga lutea]|uniref:GNAT family N-acetyltransferase n=1 Tax=Fulvivirga lutea TaxID=2810512 RepID=A0A974WHV5_9BACT|nr:GNAT family N-acetyltransferase [Fulvivirga lutea]QSE98686.1 GNAT family N-acetyltransferase [Fulvivirga lutea]